MTQSADATSRATGDGEWHTLVPPGRGADYVGVPLPPHVEWRGRFGLGVDPAGAVVRVDLAEGNVSELGRLPAELSFGPIALDASGQRWAVVERSRVVGPRRWWLNGTELPKANVSAIAFAGDVLYAVIDGKLVGLDPETGEPRFETEVSLTLISSAGVWRLATVGEHAFGPQRGSIRLVSASGEVDTHDSALDGAILAVVGGTRFAATFYSADEGHWATHVAVWDHDARAERILALPEGTRLRGDGGAITETGDAIVYGWGELDLQSGELRRYALPILGTQQPQKILGGVALSPDERHAWIYWFAAAAVLRIDREAGAYTIRPAELTQPCVHDIAVSVTGQVALAQDGLVQLLDAEGTVVHREKGMECAIGVAFSSDGSRLAYSTGDEVHVIDTKAFTKLAKAKLKGAGVISFSPDDARLLVGTGKHALLCSSADLSKQNKLSGKDDLRAIDFSGSEIVAHDYEGRAYVFDDPGVTEATKKPPAHKPRLVLKKSEAAGGVRLAPRRVAIEDGQIVVAEHRKLTAYDAKGKAQWSRPVDAGFMNGDLRVESAAAGAQLYRPGDDAPFATISSAPARAAASADGRQVVFLVHEGLLRWSSRPAQ